MKKRMLAVMFLLSLTMLTACSGTTDSAEDDVKIWRFSHEESAGTSIQDMYAQKFKELIEERTDGKVKVQVYSLGQLGDSVGAVEMLRYGVVNFAINNPATVATVVPENQLMSLHYIFSDDMEANRTALIEGNAVKELNQLYADKDMIVLDWFPEGFQVVTSNYEIRTPDDMKGFKIRVMASPLLIAAYSAYGANPTPVAYTETYSNLQLHMIDGQVNPVFAIEEMKFYEVQEYLNFMNHELFVGTFCANPEFWESLTEEEQAMVEDVVKEVNAYIFDVQNEVAETRLEKIKANKSSIILWNIQKKKEPHLAKRQRRAMNII